MGLPAACAGGVAVTSGFLAALVAVVVAAVTRVAALDAEELKVTAHSRAGRHRHHTAHGIVVVVPADRDVRTMGTIPVILPVGAEKGRQIAASLSTTTNDPPAVRVAPDVRGVLRGGAPNGEHDEDEGLDLHVGGEDL
jgi:hypothetical protein